MLLGSSNFSGHNPMIKEAEERKGQGWTLGSQLRQGSLLWRPLPCPSVPIQAFIARITPFIVASPIKVFVLLGVAQWCHWVYTQARVGGAGPRNEIGHAFFFCISCLYLPRILCQRPQKNWVCTILFVVPSTHSQLFFYGIHYQWAQQPERAYLSRDEIHLRNVSHGCFCD